MRTQQPLLLSLSLPRRWQPLLPVLPFLISLANDQNSCRMCTCFVGFGSELHSEPSLSRTRRPGTGPGSSEPSIRKFTPNYPHPFYHWLFHLILILLHYSFNCSYAIRDLISIAHLAMWKNVIQKNKTDCCARRRNGSKRPCCWGVVAGEFLRQSHRQAIFGM